MKALKILFLVLSAGLFLAGCSKDVYLQGTQMSYYDYDVRASQWEADAAGYYTVTLEVPAITNHVVRNGNVQVSRCYMGQTENDDVWTPLPAMRVESTMVDGQEYIFTTYTDYEWSARTVDVFVTASDLYMGDPPGSMSFRVFVTQ